MKKGVIICAVFLIGVICVSLASAQLQIGFESATYKIRQDYSFPDGRNQWQIKSAGNEFEPFQLALKSDSVLTNVDVEISDFTGPGKISKEQVTIFWVGYVNVETRSSLDGEVGEWPDILVPKVDAYYHEKRNSFPFTLNALRVQPIWFDVFVPENTPPGNYIAKVSVTKDGSNIFEGDVFLEVWDFTLPATSSMLSQFSLKGDDLWRGYYSPEPPNWEEDIANLMHIYIRAGLRHRLTFSPRAIVLGAWNEEKLDYENIEGTQFKVDKTNFEKTLKGFMGDGDPQVEYGDARITTLMSGFSSFYPEEIERNYGGCKGAPTIPPEPLVIRARKAAELIASVLTPEQRAIYYVLPLDEPGGGENGCGESNPELDYSSSIAMAKEIRAAGLKTRVTKSRRTELLNTDITPPKNDYWDMWIPYFKNIVGRDYWEDKEYNLRAEYDADISNGAKLIWYQSCMTHGCGSFGEEEYNGNPQYGLEYPAIFARIFPWMTFKYDVHGEGYYATVLDLIDPWYSQWYEGYYTNGEGNFFYPGLANKANNGFDDTASYGINTPSIGGIHDIPIESIRLKMIREGYEDYEYFYKLKQMGNGDYAKEQVSRAVKTTYDFTKDYNLIYSVREDIARKILSYYCGDGAINSGEECDDGDIENGDGCSSSCAVESRWSCSGQPSVCSRVVSCNDRTCDGNENCQTCPEDCGVCQRTTTEWIGPASCDGWSSCSNAYKDDGEVATSRGGEGYWHNYGFSIPSRAIIKKVEVKLDYEIIGDLTFLISSDGGATWGEVEHHSGTRAGVNERDITNDVPWTPEKLNNKNLKIKADCEKDTMVPNDVPDCRIDWMPVRVSFDVGNPLTPKEYIKPVKRGDANNDESIDLSDAIYILQFLYMGGEKPKCLDSADIDNSGVLDLTDPIYLLQHLFLGGAELPNPIIIVNKIGCECYGKECSGN